MQAVEASYYRSHAIGEVWPVPQAGMQPRNIRNRNLIGLDRYGCATYHACASFKEPYNDPLGTPDGQKKFGRSHRNARGAKAFWLDIDVGPDKAYLVQEKAEDALTDFCRAVKLPPPIVVCSGWGLH